MMLFFRQYSEETMRQAIGLALTVTLMICAARHIPAQSAPDRGPDG